jgi:hypothetical protein
LRPDFPSDEEVEVAEGACAEAHIHLQADASVSGFVLDAKGLRFSGLALELEHDPENSAEGDLLPRRRFFAESDAKGEFRFEAVSPGQYVLGTNLDLNLRDSPIPRTYYPGRRRRTEDGALPIEVRVGDSVSNLVFNFPDFGGAREIQVCVIDEHGKVVSSAEIQDASLKEGEDFAVLGKNLATDGTGCVKATGYTRATYGVRAITYPPKAEVRETDDL